MPRRLDLYEIAIIESPTQVVPEMVEVVGLYAAKQLAMWGSYGKGGVEHCSGTCPEHKLLWKRLIDCDTDHLQAILRTQWQLWYHGPHDYVPIINSILEDRGVKPDTYQTRIKLGPVWKSPEA